jgi:hypothetical protein
MPFGFLTINDLKKNICLCNCLLWVYLVMVNPETRVIRIRKSKKDRQHSAQKDKQRSTKHTHKSKYRVTRTPLKTGGEPNNYLVIAMRILMKTRYADENR